MARNDCNSYKGAYVQGPLRILQQFELMYTALCEQNEPIEKCTNFNARCVTFIPHSEHRESPFDQK